MRLSFPPPVRSPISRRASLCASLLSLALVIAGVACGGGSEAVQRLTGTPLVTGTPLGARVLAFVANLQGPTVIRTVNEFGSDLHEPSSTGHATNTYASWSPDSQQIAFTSRRGGSADVHVMNRDGSNQRRLTFETSDEGFPAWSPDGNRIAFVSNRDGNGEIYVMNADGASDSDRVWRPVAR